MYVDPWLQPTKDLKTTPKLPPPQAFVNEFGFYLTLKLFYFNLPSQKKSQWKNFMDQEE